MAKVPLPQDPVALVRPDVAQNHPATQLKQVVEVADPWYEPAAQFEQFEDAEVSENVPGRQGEQETLDIPE